ncbi:MAG: hypothetical protein HND48_19120 [Chloroflexi bacterium]|nr:hypothetical protein [Chloroflexota bacterium]
MPNRQELEVRYKIFDRFALGDQRSYYQRKVDSYRKARGQVNMIRASMGLATVVATVFAITWPRRPSTPHAARPFALYRPRSSPAGSRPPRRRP